MKFTEELSSADQNLITGIEPGCIIVQNKKIDHAHIIAPDALLAWDICSFAELESGDLKPITQLNPEVIILGTGERHILPAKPLLRALVETGVGFEIMDTPAACRTYNILVSEDRRAVVALII